MTFALLSFRTRAIYEWVNHRRCLFVLEGEHLIPEEPEVFDPSRANPKEHLAFGYGIHFCIGAPLARLELRVTLECLSQLPSLRLVSGEPPQYRQSISLRGPQHLPIQWNKPL